ncbi:hypothetical protein [Rubrolithibacter danxiaensis]|uniref:hypothetical protein n=1 Tax=Rubrolithibacter danxiaensis TaxID=3390805 RepID=UPI003BF7A337
MMKNHIHAAKYAKYYHQTNETIENFYHALLKSVKKMIATLPDEAARTVFEFNRKKDDPTAQISMHDFVSPSFYWHLECDYLDKYQIHYAFYNSPFKSQILEKFDRLCLSDKIKERKFDNYREYYNRVMKCQSAKLISILKPDSI